ncbi:DnaJ-domain-containing protein [Dendrothele bispora CBS 962.96]|uniref:DnaJ-domain-containing protein n=1 Tax=Dendrothele bispora (strain CBS 962.96) TaxID=1314807 RepID=A0A4S8MZ85_DENBC|nr:DnaJ-domain-containing protein [Dendrothele bispora CBS 962.96]
MRFALLFTLFAVLAAVVLAWEKEDHEIFDLVSAVESSEGKGTTFYSWLDVPSTASTTEISRAYRKMSMQMHPDKNPGNKKMAERFARLGVVAAILRNSESRKRYDFFYKNGVPKWRGTGYYYSRFRPGLGSVIIFLIILTSALQYLVQRMNYKRDLERVETVIRDARLAAWGAKMIPIEGQRKVKVNLGGQRGFDEDGNLVGGKTIDMVVSGDAVYILDPSGDMHPIDASAATPPGVSRTWFFLLMRHLYQLAFGRREQTDVISNPGPHSESELDEASGYDSSTASEKPSSGTVTPREDAKSGARIPTTMAGGKRRKAMRKR